MIKWIALGVLLLYIAAVFSPLPRYIGRSNAPLAALFSPPSFNFVEHYEDGSVYGFRIGSSKEEVVNQIERLGLSEFRFHRLYREESQDPLIRVFDNKLDLLNWGEERDIWRIAYFKKSNETIFSDWSFTFFFSDHRLEKIKVGVVNFEAI